MSLAPDLGPLAFIRVKRQRKHNLTPQELSEDLAALGVREDFVCETRGFFLGRELRAVALGYQDYRMLSQRTPLTEDLAVATEVDLRKAARSLAALIDLTDEGNGLYRFFVVCDERPRAVIVPAAPFVRLVRGRFLGVHQGVRAVGRDTLAEAVAKAADDFNRGVHYELYVSRDGYEPALIVSAARYLGLYLQRKLRGLGCPDCGEVDCNEWTTSARQIRSGDADLPLREALPALDDMLEATQTLNEAYVISKDERPSMVLCSEVEFTRLCLGPAVPLGRRCDDFDLELAATADVVPVAASGGDDGLRAFAAHLGAETDTPAAADTGSVADSDTE